MANAYFAEPEENDEYLDEAERAHEYDLETLADLFESPYEPGNPAKASQYTDFSVAMYNDWKVVSFEVANWTKTEYNKRGKDLFAVLR